MDPRKDPRLQELIATTRREVELYKKGLEDIFTSLDQIGESPCYDDAYCSAWRIGVLGAEFMDDYEDKVEGASGPLVNYIIDMREREIFGTTANEVDEQRRKEKLAESA